MYGAIKETIESDTIEVCFLYKVKDDILAYVDDDEKYNELLAFVAGAFVTIDIKKIFQTK